METKIERSLYILQNIFFFFQQFRQYQLSSIVLVDIEDINIIKRIKVYALDLTVFRVTVN